MTILKKPDIRTRDGLARTLRQKPRRIQLAVGARAALRVVPLWLRLFPKIHDDRRNVSSQIILALFRCVAASRIAASSDSKNLVKLASIAADAARDVYTDRLILGHIALDEAGKSASDSAYSSATGFSADTVKAAASAADAAFDLFSSKDVFDETDIYSDSRKIWESTNNDIVQFDVFPFEKALTTALWVDFTINRSGWTNKLNTEMPYWVENDWSKLKQELYSIHSNWKLWIDWYEAVLDGREPWNLPHPVGNDLMLEALSWPEDKWKRLPAAINADLQALVDAARAKLDMPDQRPAPILVEERDGKVAKVSDRDGPLAASERDFNQWREPIAAHIDELLAGDFKAGTNHGRVRERLDSMRRSLEGSVANVKESQFRLGYDISRFGGLISAYESGGDDMPMLGADVLKDLKALDVGLRMGLSKLERWAEFREEAIQQAADPDGRGERVAEAIEAIAGTMEKQPHYFSPELPASFRWVAEAIKDPGGASKITFFGAVRSVENLFSFLGQRALGIGKASIDAIEEHINKIVATALIASVGGAALKLAGLVPENLAWLGNLLRAIGGS